MVEKIYNSILFRFLLIGCFGIVTNLIVFYIFSDMLYINPLVSATIAFCLSVSQNYIFNHFWGFKELVDYPLSVIAFFKYVAVNIIGLLINLLVLKIIIDRFAPHPQVIAQLLAICCGTFINYFGAKEFVFRKKNA